MVSKECLLMLCLELVITNCIPVSLSNYLPLYTTVPPQHCIPEWRHGNTNTWASVCCAGGTQCILTSFLRAYCAYCVPAPFHAHTVPASFLAHSCPHCPCLIPYSHCPHLIPCLHCMGTLFWSHSMLALGRTVSQESISHCVLL